MLVLQRDVHQSLVLTTPDGKRIIVTVTAVRSGKVRLGVTADKSITVNRAEVQQAIDAGRK